jgi:hypothetical protein
MNPDLAYKDMILSNIMNPAYRNGIAIFTSDQIDIYGCPSYYGYERFEVHETPTYVTDWKMEHQYELKQKVPHIYIRSERFQVVVNQILGMTINASHRTTNTDCWHDMIERVAELETDYWMGTRLKIF